VVARRPDNEPAVSCIDWKVGDFNAKYYAIQMLAAALGSGPKSFFAANVTIHTVGAPARAPALAGGANAALSIVNGSCGHTGFESDCNAAALGAFNITKENITDLAGCVARVKKCAKVNFASFSADPDHMDCSWYATCPGWPTLTDDAAIYQSETVRPVPPPPPPPASVKVYPYIVHETEQRGMLIVCRVHTGCGITLSLAGLGVDGTAHALVLEGVGAEPGFRKPVNRTIGADGALQLGPFGIALVR
jgi:hypothetical protein